MTQQDSASKIITLTQETFRPEVVESDVPVLVDFWAEWCGPCKRMNPVLEELAAEMEGTAKVAKVNVDEQRMLGAMFQVMSIPALMVFKDGKKVAEMTGVQSKGALQEKINAAL